MFIVKLVAFFYLLPSSSVRCLFEKSTERCLEQIWERSFANRDLVFFVDFNQNFSEINLVKTKPVVLQTSLKKIKNFTVSKADAYIILITRRNFRKIFAHLLKTYEWNPRAKFVLIFEERFKISAQFTRFLRKMHVYDVIFLATGPKGTLDVSTYFPYTYSGGTCDKIVPIDFCTDGSFENGSDLFPKKLPPIWSDFTMRVLLFEYPPFVICSKCEEAQRTGLEYLLFELVQKVLGFKVEYVHKRITNWGKKLADGSYSGAYGFLRRYEIDCGIGVFYANFTENWDFDLSFAYVEDASKWLVPAAKPRPHSMDPLLIFKPYFWLSLVLSLLIVPYVLLAINRAEFKSYPESVMVCFESLLGQALVVFPRSGFGRLVLGMWFLFCCVIVWSFQCKLVYVLNFQRYGAQISNLRELIDSKLDFGFYKGASYLFMGSSSADELYVYDHFTECPIDNSCIDRVAYGGDFATIKAKKFIQYMTSNFYLGKDGKPLIYVFDENVYNILITIAFAKGFPMLDRVNKVLLNLKSSGFVQFYYRKFDDLAIKAQEKAQRVGVSATALSLSSMSWVFYVLLMGWAVAFLVFVVELYLESWRKLFKRK